MSAEAQSSKQTGHAAGSKVPTAPKDQTTFFSFPNPEGRTHTPTYEGIISIFPVSQPLILFILPVCSEQPSLFKRSRDEPYSILFRFGSFVPTGQPRRLGGPDAHHAHLQQPQPAGRRPLPQHHLRPGQRPRHGPHESRRPGRTPGAAAQSPTREEEDQSGEHVGAAAGGALPHAGRPGLHHHCTQRGQNLQVGAHTDLLTSTIVPPRAFVQRHHPSSFIRKNFLLSKF